MFQGCSVRVIKQMKGHIAFYLIGMLCIAHKTNLAILVLNNLSMVACIVQVYFSFLFIFSHNPKNVMERWKITTIKSLDFLVLDGLQKDLDRNVVLHLP
jgi:hypothetical protein